MQNDNSSNSSTKNNNDGSIIIAERFCPANHRVNDDTFAGSKRGYCDSNSRFDLNPLNPLVFKI